jgi:3-oxoacyl-[acyl-carrier protein] reductase
VNSLAGRVALVTGSARGIGAAIARRLGADGAAVGVVDLDARACDGTVAAICSAGGSAIALAADVSDEQAVAAAVDSVAAQFGGLHVLVNNAGVLRDNLLFKMSQDDWDTVMSVHLRGAFLCSRAAQSHMVTAGFGRIVNLSSVSALGNRGQANYSAAKAGLQGLTRTLAIELGPFGVTVNAVAPGFIETAMTKATAERMGSSIDDMRERFEQVNPVRRGGVPDDIANTVAFFASPDSGYITGQVLYVDGGRRLL